MDRDAWNKLKEQHWGTTVVYYGQCAKRSPSERVMDHRTQEFKHRNVEMIVVREHQCQNAEIGSIKDEIAMCKIFFNSKHRAKFPLVRNGPGHHGEEAFSKNSAAAKEVDEEYTKAMSRDLIAAVKKAHFVGDWEFVCSGN